MARSPGAVRRIAATICAIPASTSAALSRGARIRGVFAQLAIDKPPFSSLLSDNRDREQARRQRIAQANPQIPVTVFWLMVAAVATSLGWIAFQLPE